MKRSLLVLALTLMFSGAVFADAALVIKLDEGCSWTGESTFSLGDVHFVLNDGDQWVLSCHGEIVAGGYPDRAEVVRSTDENPVGTCFTPFGTTQNWHTVATPAGNSKFTCWGYVD